MGKDNKPFTEEYETESATESASTDIIEVSQVLDTKDETEEESMKYGLAKPRRYRIRGKVIHD